MCGIYCVYKQSRPCQLPFCASPIFHFEIGDFSVYISYNWYYCKWHRTSDEHRTVRSIVEELVTFELAMSRFYVCL